MRQVLSDYLQGRHLVYAVLFLFMTLIVFGVMNTVEKPGSSDFNNTADTNLTEAVKQSLNKTNATKRCRENNGTVREVNPSGGNGNVTYVYCDLSTTGKDWRKLLN